MARAKAERSINSILLKIKTHARLDKEATSTLVASDFEAANHVLQPVFVLCKSLVSRKEMELDEAVLYLREAGLCDLLVGLLRRWPWPETQQGRLPVTHLALLPPLLSSLLALLHVAVCVRSSQQAAAYAEMSKRCLYDSSAV